MILTAVVLVFALWVQVVLLVLIALWALAVALMFGLVVLLSAAFASVSISVGVDLLDGIDLAEVPEMHYPKTLTWLDRPIY